jgi:RNA polymerase sigma-70 factor (ECF subfamily)
LTEEEAIKRLVAGDKDAFATLYDLYIDKVYRFVYYRTHHRETAEDLTSLAFTKAFDKFGTFDQSARFSSWIFRIARNTVFDHYRTHKSASDIEEAYNLADKTNLTRDYELQEKLEAAKHYLDKLPAEHRDLIVMRLWDGLSYQEISEILGKNEASLRVNFSRIIGKMQKEIVLTILLAALIIK